MTHGDGWQITPGEALAELLRWNHSAQLMAIRACDPTTGALTREGDVRLFVMAVREVLRFAVFTRDLLDEPDRATATEAVTAFDAKIPAASLIRDVSDHWEEYLQGIGLRYRAGRPGDYWPETEWLTITRPAGSWGVWKDGTYVLFISPKPGSVIEFDVRAAAAACAELSSAIQETLPEPGAQVTWFLVGPTGVGKSGIIRSLNDHGIRAAVLDEVLDIWPDDPRDLLSKITDWDLTRLAIDHLIRSGVRVIAIGAGTQGIDHWRSLQQPPLAPVFGPWLEHRAAQVIALMDEPENIWRRPADVTLEQYLAFEFNPHRRRAYAAAGHTVTRTGRTPGDVLADVLKLVDG